MRDNELQTFIIVGWFVLSIFEKAASSPVRSQGKGFWAASSIFRLRFSYSCYHKIRTNT